MQAFRLPSFRPLSFRPLALILLAGLAAPAYADIYKCADADGRVTYTNDRSLGRGCVRLQSDQPVSSIPAPARKPTAAPATTQPSPATGSPAPPDRAAGCARLAGRVAAVAATRMKTRQFWPDTENGPGNGTDDVGFGGLPAGFRTQRGDFFLGDRVGYFWSLTELSPTTTTAHMLFDYDAKIFRIEYEKAMGMSVRCLKA